MKRIILLGSTGSIGTQTLDVVRANPDEFQVLGLTAYDNAELFEKQVREFQPRYTLLASTSENPGKTLMAFAASPDADIVVNAISGFAGLMPTFAACKAGKKIALANKESLVMAGELIMETARKFGAEILPVDSEPSAVWQMLSLRSPLGRSNLTRSVIPSTFASLSVNSARDLVDRFADARDDIKKIILTASGGPFWKFPRNELTKVTVAQALKHPTWRMGEKITIDSATLMNKAFEIIETRWFFDIPPEKIDIVIHRQSIMHALVEFSNGNTQAVLSPPDMRIPIAAALGVKPPSLPRLDISQLALTFEKPDYSILEGPKLAYEVLKSGGIMPAALCLADEIAVQNFLHGKISFLGIYDFINQNLNRVKNMSLSIEALQELPRTIL